MFDFVDFRAKKGNGYHSNVIPCTIHPQNLRCIAKIDKHNEHAIYHFMQSIPLGVIAPKYYGLWESHDYAGFPKKEQEKRMLADGNFNYIIMEDLMSGFKSPNFVDIKLGTRASDVRTKKRSIERLAYLVGQTTSADFGFRITDILNNSKNKKDGSKKTQRREMAHNIFETSNFFKTFFSTHQLKLIYDELKHMRGIITLTLRQFPGFRIYASSVFITYDSEAPEDSEVRVKLIDFAHVHFDIDKDGGDRNSLEYDDGVLRGLDGLILLVGLILCERKVPLGNENLVDPEEEQEEKEKKAQKAKKDKNKDKKASKDKDKDKKKPKDKSKDTKNEKSKEKDKKTEKESSNEKVEKEPKSEEKEQKSEEKKEDENQKDQNPPKNIETETTQKKDKETSENNKTKSEKDDSTEKEIKNQETQNSDEEKDNNDEEEEEEAAESENEPIDSESFNDRQSDSESTEKSEEAD